jgi:hypothetical protein
MKLMKPTEQSFEKLLADWQVVPLRDPQFRDQVWSRITDGPARASWASYWRGHVVAMAVAFTVAAYVRGLDARTMRMP